MFAPNIQLIRKIIPQYSAIEIDENGGNMWLWPHNSNMGSERSIDYFCICIQSPNYKTGVVEDILRMLPTQLTHAVVPGCTGFAEPTMLRTTAHPQP